MSVFEKDITRENSYELRDIAKGDIIPLVSDVMFHTMLNNKKRKKYVSYLLSLILEEDYEEILNTIEFESEELDKENYYESKRTVDLVCRVKDKIYNIGINNNSNVSNLERNISYLNDLYKSSMKTGSEYNYNYCIQININNFNFKGNKKIIERFSIKDDEGEVLTEKIKYIYIYLPLIKDKWYTRSELSDLEKLLITFNERNSSEVKEIIGGNKMMEEYRRDAEEACEDREIIGLYDKEKTREMLHKMDVEEATRKGIKGGIEQEKISLIRNMIKNNFKEEDICKCLDITEKELNSYKKML